MSSTEYLTEKIGEKYKYWGPADIVLITAPTGSGKSYFVLHTLLKYAIGRGEKILYLVNRKILKKQLDKCLQDEVSKECYEYFGEPIVVTDYIMIMTYQSIESQLLQNRFEWYTWFKSFSYVVYDECHYFINDATFNTNTQLSYDCLRNAFDEKIQIFMSATMNAMKSQIIKYFVSRNLEKDQSPYPNIAIKQNLPVETRIKEYSCAIDYSYVDLYAFLEPDDIQVIVSTKIVEDDEKWLIFTDNIDRGKELRRALLELVKEKKRAMKETDIVFVDADYENNQNAMAVVDELTNYNAANAQVIITTPVMDNGISFHDIELKNIVILADTEEAFIQMLGRKRISEPEDTKIKVFICKRDISHFTKRLAYAEKIIKFYETHAEAFKWRSIIVDPQLHNYVEITPFTMARDCFQPYPMGQQNILNEILGNEQSYQSASRFCYVLNGVVAVNKFAIERFYALRKFYNDLIAQLKEDPNAFLNIQKSWLQKCNEDVDIADCERIITHEYKEVIEKHLEQWIDMEFETKEQKKFKDNVNFRKAMLYFLQRGRNCTSTERDNIEKNDRSLTPEVFNLCMRNAELPYEMRKRGGSHFIVVRVE